MLVGEAETCCPLLHGTMPLVEMEPDRRFIQLAMPICSCRASLEAAGRKEPGADR